MLLQEKVALSLAGRFTGHRVAVEGVVGDRLLTLAGLVQVTLQRGGIDSLAVVDQVCQVIGVAALGRCRQDERRLGSEDSAAAFLLPVDHLPGVVQRLDLAGDDAGTILGADGQQTPPEILLVVGLEQFDGPVSGQPAVAASDRLLKRRGYVQQGIAADRVQLGSHGEHPFKE